MSKKIIPEDAAQYHEREKRTIEAMMDLVVDCTPLAVEAADWLRKHDYLDADREAKVVDALLDVATSRSNPREVQKLAVEAADWLRKHNYLSPAPEMMSFR